MKRRVYQLPKRLRPPPIALTVYTCGVCAKTATSEDMKGWRTLPLNRPKPAKKQTPVCSDACEIQGYADGVLRRPPIVATLAKPDPNFRPTLKRRRR